MQTLQSPKNLAKAFGVLALWIVLNSLLWVIGHTLVGFLNYGVFGFQSTNNPLGFILGVVLGSMIGLVQWVILSRNFSISALWILSCAIGLAAHYTLNWIAGAILMGAFQQYLIKRKLNDSFLWFIALFIGIGINAEGIRRIGDTDSLALLCLIAIFAGATYAFPTGLVLAWYKYRLKATQQVSVQQEPV